MSVLQTHPRTGTGDPSIADVGRCDTSVPAERA